MTYDEFKQNFLPEFLNIKSFAKKVKYVDSKLQRIGSGSGRIVYDIDGEKVLKLAKNIKGVAQNEAEGDVGRYRDTRHIVTEIIDEAEDNTWIVSEKAKKVNEKRIVQLTGIPSLTDLHQYCINFVHRNNGGKKDIFKQTPEMIEYLNENEFVQDITNLIANYNQNPGDYLRPSSFGEVLRNGQPSIVLTDYGFNEYVNKTHYSENHKIFEMYNFADGNDDILSDIGNTGEVRHGMWALIPQGVGDGDDNINEEFVKFIENRNKYPKNAVSGIPYIVDEFHNIVNNLNEVLKKVDNKKKFYNNLLELQNYLIRGKFHNREPLQMEMLDEVGNENGDNRDISQIPPIVPMALEKSYSDSIVNDVANKLNLGTPNYLGEGSYGQAYQVNNNKVLKLTSDVSEIVNGGKVMNSHPKTIVPVYNIYKIFDTINNRGVYGLLMEFVPDKPVSEFFRYNRIVDTLGSDDEMSFGDIIILMKNRNNTIEDNEAIRSRMGFILTAKPEANISQSDRQQTYKYMMGLFDINRDLIGMDIRTDEYSNPPNIGYLNGVLTFFDIGGIRKAVEPPLSNKNYVILPESVNDIISEEVNNLIFEEVNNLIFDEIEHLLHERIKSSMPGSSTVDVKKKCRLAGNGNTSTPCNQGDISNLDIKPLKETVAVDFPQSKIQTFESYPIINDGQKVGEIELMNRDNDYLVLDKIFIDKEFRGQGFANKAIKLLFDYADKHNQIITLTPDNLWGANKEKLRKWYLSLGFVMNKGRNKDFQTMQLMYRLPKGQLSEEIDASEAYGDEKSLETILNGKRNVALIGLSNPILKNKVINSGLNIIKVKQAHHPESLETSIVYRNGHENRANRLHEFMKSRGGYVNDQSPKEAYEIGKLLDYSDESIMKYINRLYVKNPDGSVRRRTNIEIQQYDNERERNKIPVMPEKTHADYNDLDESVDMGWFSGSQVVDDSGNPLVVYHGTNKDFTRFNLKNAAQPIIWFSSDRDKIERGDSGAAGRSRIIPAYLSIKKMAGWDEYNKYGLGQLHDMGYDGAKLDDDYFVFSPKQIKIIKDKVKNENISIFAENNTVMNETELMSLQDLPFKQDVEGLGGKIFSVGGAVRDEFLGKESKDLDILITGIPMEELEQILSKYGKVDAVGKSFGVLKFKPKGATEDIDIAIPRTEKPTGAGGHQGFDVTSDHALPIEKDLERRDFTINAIAKDIDGNIVDPYHGQEDLKNKIIRIVNPEAFSDDALRMLRAVQFASRFGFTIEPQTMQMIKDNASRIREIPAERILTEFDKIVKKGDKLTGAFLLKQTGLLKEIFGKDAGILVGKNVWDNIKTMGEFIYLLSHNLVENPAEFYKNNLKGEIDTAKEIKALDMAFNSGEATNLVEARSIAHNMFVTSPQSLQSQIIPSVIKTAANELLQGKYPKTLSELAVNGNDLMALGLQGKEVGDALKMMLLKIYSGKVNNNKDELLSLLLKK